MNRWKLQAKRRSYLLIEAVVSCGLIVASVSFLGHSIYSRQKLNREMEAFERDVQVDAAIAYVKRAFAQNPHLISKLHQTKSLQMDIPVQGHFITQKGQKPLCVCLSEEKRSTSEGLDYALVRMKVGRSSKKKGPLMRLALPKENISSKLTQK